MADVAASIKANRSLKRRLLSPQTGIPLVALVLVIALLTNKVDIGFSDTWEHITTLNPWWYVAAFVSHYSTFIFRGARWRVLIANAHRHGGGPPPTVAYAGRVILMGWFVNSVTWFRMGDAYRAYAYASDTRTSFSRSMGTVMADRFVDLVVVAVLIAVGVGALFIGGQIVPPVLLVAVAAGAIVVVGVGLVAMILARRWVAPRLPERLRDMYHRFHSGTMDSFGRIPLVFALGVAGWLCEAGRLFCVVMAVGTPVALGLVLFVPMANGLLTAVPLTPGGLGLVETGVTGLLGLELAVEAALAVALVDRSISYVSIVATGGVAFVVHQIRAARRTHVPGEGETE